MIEFARTRRCRSALTIYLRRLTFLVILVGWMTEVEAGGTADLVLVEAAAPERVEAGRSFIVAAAVFNRGPAVAVRSRVVISTSASIFEPSRCQLPEGGSRCSFSLGDLQQGVSNGRVIRIRMRSILIQAMDLSWEVSSDVDDPDPSNNTAFTRTKATGDGPSDLVVSGAVEPTISAVGSEVEFLVGVGNDGPRLASGVRLVADFPDFTLISWDERCRSTSSSRLDCGLGNLPPLVPPMPLTIRARVDREGVTAARFDALSTSQENFPPDNAARIFVEGVPPNARPVVQVIPPASSPRSGQRVVLMSEASDEDGDPLTFEWQQTAGVPVALSGADTAVVSFVIPYLDRSRVFQFELEVSDGRETVASLVTFEAEPFEFYFPLFGNGEAGPVGFATEFLLVNVGSHTPLQVDFFDAAGDALTLATRTDHPTQDTPSQLGPGQAARLETDGLGELSIGYGRVRASEGVDGVQVFSGRQIASDQVLYQAGVPASFPMTEFTLFVDTLENRDTGLALLRPPGSGPAALVTLRLYDLQFQLLAEEVLELAPGALRSQFVREYLSAPPQQVEEMEGALAVSSDAPILALGLRQNNASSVPPEGVPTLTVIPLVPGVGAESVAQATARHQKPR